MSNGAMQVYPISAEQYDDLSATSPYTTPFHEREYCEVMAEQFNRQCQLVGVRSGDHQWIANVFTDPVDSSRNSLSMNIVGYGGPLPVSSVKDGGAAEMLRTTAAARAIGVSLRGKQISSQLYPAPHWESLPLENMTCKVALQQDAESNFANVITGNARTAVRKAEKSGITVRQLDTDNEEDAKAALHLLHMTQAQVGSSYLTSPSLFNALNRMQGQKVVGRTLVAEKDTAIVGMATYISNSKELFHLFHGWDRDFASSCPNQALIWRMIQIAAEDGIPTFNMGHSHTDALLQAKLRWGGKLENSPKIVLAC